jgi:hypothetical protein
MSIELLTKHAQEYVDNSGVAWIATTQWALVDGELGCVGLELRSFGMAGGNARGIHSDRPIGRIDSEMLRRVRVGEILQRSRAALFDAVEGRFDIGKVDLGLTARERRSISSTRKGNVGRKPLAPDVLEEVCDIYSRAAIGKGSPTRAVAEHFNITYSAADGRVRKARRLGLLPPTEPGVARPRAAKHVPKRRKK